MMHVCVCVCLHGGVGDFDGTAGHRRGERVYTRRACSFTDASPSLSHLTTSYQHSESELWLEHERAKNAQLLTRLEEAEKKLRAKTGAVISSPSPLKSPLKTSSPRHSPRNSPGQPLGDLLSHGGKLVRSNTF